MVNSTPDAVSVIELRDASGSSHSQHIALRRIKSTQLEGCVLYLPSSCHFKAVRDCQGVYLIFSHFSELFELFIFDEITFARGQEFWKPL